MFKCTSADATRAAERQPVGPAALQRGGRRN